jgi:hypothetical protein
MPDPSPAPVLPYGIPAPPPSHRRINRATVIGSALLLLAFYIGLAPGVGGFAFDYTRRIPIWEAVTAVVRVPPWEVATDTHTSRFVWFVALAAGGCAGFVLCRPPWAKVVIAFASAVVPVLAVRGAVRLLVHLPMVLPEFLGALVGRADGESWSEGMVAWGAMAAWMVFWALIGSALIVATFRRQLNRPLSRDDL